MLEAAEKAVSRSFLCLGFVVSQSVFVSRTACLFCRAECVVCVVVVCVIIINIIIFYFILMVATTCGRKHKPHTTQEDRLTERKVSQHSCVWFQRWSVSRSFCVV